MRGNGRLCRGRILRILAILVTILSLSLASPSGPVFGVADATGYLPMLYVEGNTIRTIAGPSFLVGTNVRGQARNPMTDGQFDDWWTYRDLDAANIKSYGFNVIRLITYWEAIETSSSPASFTYDGSYIEKIRQTVEAYNQNGIYVIIDLHQHASLNALGKFIPTLGNDMDFADQFYSQKSSTSAREHLSRLWLTLSITFRGLTGVAGYDICNEPHRSKGSLSNQQVANYWFDIADYVVGSLRAAGDNHVVFVNFSPSATSTVFMQRTLRDRNVVYAPHFYYGINQADLTVSNSDYAWLKGQFDSNVNAKIAQLNVPFIMEELGFGGNAIANGDSRYIWLSNVLNIIRSSSLMQGWIYFCYYSYSGVVQGGGWQDILASSQHSLNLRVYVKNHVTRGPIVGASIYLDGILLGTTDSLGTASFRQVTLGTHGITITKEGYDQYTGAFRITPSTRLIAYLDPA